MTDVPGGHERAVLAESGQRPGPAEAAPGQRTAGPSLAGGPAQSAAGVLADRIAAALVHHEPGWRLPRHTALARRYRVSTAEIEAAVDELAARHLIRHLSARRRGRDVLRRLPGAGGPAGEETGAVASLDLLPPAVLPELPDEERAGLIPAGRPRELRVEMQLPPRSVARSLRLSAGEPAAMVTMRFDAPETERPVALTVAAVRYDLVRIVVESDKPPLRDGGGGFPRTPAQAAEHWEP